VKKQVGNTILVSSRKRKLIRRQVVIYVNNDKKELFEN
jgi:hypothetical protein